MEIQGNVFENALAQDGFGPYRIWAINVVVIGLVDIHVGLEGPNMSNKKAEAQKIQPKFENKQMNSTLALLFGHVLNVELRKTERREENREQRLGRRRIRGSKGVRT